MTLNANALQRVNVVGVSGCGKSTFARALATKLNIPYIEIDQLYWLPNWAEPNDDTFFPLVRQALSADKWVLDGNYDRTMPMKLERMTCWIWIDYSFTRNLFQVIGRTLKRNWRRQELWPNTGNRESLARTFSRHSIILWMLTSRKRTRERYFARQSDPRLAGVKHVHLRSPAEAKRFLDRL